MTTVQTAGGSVPSADLGVTLMHEHIFVLSADVQANYPAEWGSEDARIDDAVAKLTAARELGIRTIVDPTVVGLGRYIPRIATIAAQVDVNIVVATGLYTYADAPFFFRYRGLDRSEPDPMVAMFVSDITDGIAGTGVRAGLLKCAIDRQGLTPDVERVLRAVAAAHRQTGAPITVHTHPRSQQGLAVHRVLREHEVDPARVVLAHSGDSSDADHLQELAELGYVLGMDRFGINLEMSFDARADIVAEMCRRGFAESMVLSHDAACYIDWIDPAMVPLLPQWNYTHIHTEVLPALQERGVTDEQIQTMLVDVPRRYFETTGLAEAVGTASVTRP